jgi:SAM-dependent methyltransferase
MTPAPLSFDRAAEYYDETRAINDEALGATIDLLTGAFEGAGPVLEIGVGTGILALPLAARGVDLVGLDVSVSMMRKLVDKAAGRPPLALIRGDATRLPMRDGTMSGAYARWVLHLIPGWREAVVELCRVVRPGGSVLIEPGGYTGRWYHVWLRFQEIAGDHMGTVGLDVRAGLAELDEVFSGAGATPRELPPTMVTDSVTLAEFFDRLRRRLYSWTWTVPDDVLVDAIARVSAWAEERWGPLDHPLESEHPMIWRAYDLA